MKNALALEKLLACVLLIPFVDTVWAALSQG